MTITSTAIPQPEPLYLPTRRTWTRDEFERALTSGVFGADERLELIEGEIVGKVTQNSAPARAIRAVEEALRRIFGEGHDVRVQLPLALGTRSRPEPDVAVVSSSFNDFKTQHPTTAVLLVEVSDTILQMDRRTKTGLYAREGVAEYWIVNLTDRVLEVHREPTPSSGQPLGHHYRSVRHVGEAETVTPLVGSGEPIRVADLLP
jgi:Uma2 family endonuclease